MGETVLPKIVIILIETKQSNKTKRSVFKIAFTVSGKIGICFKTSVKQEKSLSVLPEHWGAPALAGTAERARALKSGGPGFRSAV